MKMGLGKTYVVLSFITLNNLRPALVVGPKEVIRTTWPEQIAEHGFPLTYHIYLGKDRVDPSELMDVDIVLCSYESIQYMDKTYPAWPAFQHLVLDEAHMARTPSSQRTRMLKRRRGLFKRVDIMTGTIMPKSLKNLWAPFYILDGGKRLGNTATGFVQSYLMPDNPYVEHPKLIPQPGAMEKVMSLISGVTFSAGLEALAMPELILNKIWVELPDKARRAYDDMEASLVMELDDTEVRAKNRGVAHGKLRQMAAGCVYRREGGVAITHNAKRDALHRLIGSLDTPLMVIFSYRHVIDRMVDGLKVKHAILDGRASDMDRQDMLLAWNGGMLPVLFLQSAAGGLGLNLQKGPCQDICILEPNPDAGYYEQSIFRVWRAGSPHKSIVLHYIAARGTVDVSVMAMVSEKIQNQDRLHEGVR